MANKRLVLLVDMTPLAEYRQRINALIASSESCEDRPTINICRNSNVNPDSKFGRFFLGHKEIISYGNGFFGDWFMRGSDGAVYKLFFGGSISPREVEEAMGLEIVVMPYAPTTVGRLDNPARPKPRILLDGKPLEVLEEKISYDVLWTYLGR